LISEAYVVQVIREALYLVLLVSAPALLASLAVGLLVSVVQATTQLQDQTLAFVPKLIAVLATLAVTGPWIGQQLGRFTQALLQSLPMMR
jgi:flagellar biosynthesis protein FliQ